MMETPEEPEASVCEFCGARSIVLDYRIGCSACRELADKFACWIIATKPRLGVPRVYDLAFNLLSERRRRDLGRFKLAELNEVK